MLEDKPIEIPKHLNCKITNFPYLYENNNMKSSHSNIEYTDKINDIYEDFNSDTNNDNKLCEISNMVLLIVFSILLIIYFTIYQK